MSKITMTTPLVEMDGDEMTRILWQMIKDELLIPFIDLKTEYYDLGLEERNRTDDQVTVESAKATMKYGVAVKCATITPNAARMTEYNLKEMWKSPNGTISAMLDGTVFRAPIVVKGIEPNVKKWVKPITIARHAYGDVYKATEMKVPGPGKAELVFTAEDGTETRELIHEFKGAGVIQGQHNLDDSLKALQEAALSMHWIQSRIYGLPQKIPYQRSMTIHSKISSRKSLMQSTREVLRSWNYIFLHTDRRCSCPSNEIRRWIYLGMQEL